MDRFAYEMPQQHKEARRACYEKLVNLRMEQRQDPDGYTFKLLEEGDLTKCERRSRTRGSKTSHCEDSLITTSS